MLVYLTYLIDEKHTLKIYVIFMLGLTSFLFEPVIILYKDINPLFSHG